MLQLQHLTITHRHDLHPLIQDFSFTLNPTDKVALIGEEGNGKSSLLKAIADPTSLETYATVSGSITASNVTWGYLPQSLPLNQQNLSIWDYFLQEPAFSWLTPSELTTISQTLTLSPEFFYQQQLTNTLSGGERIKLQLARLLMKQPNVLLLDEPSNDLDLATVRWLTHFLKQWPGALMVVSHDEHLITDVANVILHFEQLRRKTTPQLTVARLTYPDYQQQRFERLTKQAQLAKHQEADYRKQQVKLTQIRQKVAHQQATISRSDAHGGKLLKKKMHVLKAQERRLDVQHQQQVAPPELEEPIRLKLAELPVLPASKLIVSFHRSHLTIGSRQLASDIDLHVFARDKLGLVGANGVGKTTLLRQIKEDLQERTDLKMGYMPQNYDELLHPHETPISFLSTHNPKSTRTEIQTFLGCMAYTPNEMTHKLTDLSGGQRAKLLLLNLIFQNCNVLLLDEPTRNFSPLSAATLCHLLATYPGTIISVSHDQHYLDHVCNRYVELTPAGLTSVTL